MPVPPLADRLLDRVGPVARLDALLSAASEGRGGALLLEGEPGIGKTALLACASRMARERGMVVLATRGGELESLYAYGAVRQLFEGLLAGADEARRSALLSGAAALAAAVFHSPAAGHESPDAALSAEHGLYWLTAGLAAERPLVLLVDDAHWVDEPSLRWLVYLVRRLEGLAAAVVVATRPGLEPDSVLGVLARDGVTERLVVSALGRDAVATLVHDALGDGASEAFCEACRRATGGNPLLLGELLRIAATERISADEDGTARLHELAPSAIGPSVLGRFGNLPPAASAVAQAVAVLGSDAELRHAAALAQLSVPAAAEAADAMVRAGLLEAGRPLRFSHPIVRSAVYADLPAGRRATLHADAARMLEAEGVAAEHIAAHLIACERAGDDWVVQQLRAAAAAALDSGAPDAAAVFLRRALDEPPTPAARPVVLRELGVAEGFAQDPAAAVHLIDAIDRTDDPRERAAITLDLVRVAMPGERVDDAVRLADEAIAGLGDTDGELALQLESALIGGAILDAAQNAVAREHLAQIAAHEPDGTTPGERLRLVWLAFERFQRAAPATQVVALLERALGGRQLLAEQTADSQVHTLALNVLAVCDELEAAEARFNEALAESQARGSMVGFGICSCFRTWATFPLGRVLEAEADLDNAMRVSGEGGLEIIRGYARAQLALVMIERGDLTAARDALAGVPDDLEHFPRHDAHFLLHARGRVALAGGDNAAAATDLEACGRRELASGSRNPAWIPWRSDAATARSALGDDEQARALAADELALAREFGAPRAIGVALRGLALTERPPVRLELLEEAVVLLENSPARLEHARALVTLGAAFRAAGRRTDARVALREGLDLASRCGARGLAARARQELIADGARPRRDALRGRDALTAGEQRVARMAADGLANREIAQALFVTTKTVETHLGSVYSKLAIAGRRHLATALAEATTA